MSSIRQFLQVETNALVPSELNSTPVWLDPFDYAPLCGIFDWTGLDLCEIPAP